MNPVWSMNLHPLLSRQLKRLGLEAQSVAGENAAWTELLARVSSAYHEHDQDRYLLERSQDLSSQEMTQLYLMLREERDQLEARVRERTAALEVSEGRLKNLLSLSTDWVWEQDAELRFTYLSDGFERITGVAATKLLGDQRLFNHGFEANPGDHEAHEAALSFRRPFRDFTYQLATKTGETRYIRTSGVPVFDANGQFAGYRGVGCDVTSSTVADLQIQQLARFDAVTQLPNRNMFVGELEVALQRATEQRQELAVCFIDLDRFKTVNDTLGHAAGDELLCIMAQRLRSTLRGTDLVARVGGDEFVVLIQGFATESDVGSLAAKLLVAVGEPLSLQGSVFELTASVGVARFPADGVNSAQLLMHADAAMYQAKAQGRNNVKFYTAALAELAARELEIESSLRLSMVRNELLLYFQPKVGALDERLVGLEALLRWNHPQHGMVPPGEFIAIAEERGLILAIGRWVIAAACRQIAQWRGQGYKVPPVAVNLSPRQFADPTLLAFVEDQLVSNGLSGGDLEVEVTEGVLMSEPDRAAALLQQLESLGVRAAIDDFGTGYSSLSYLKRFSVRAVKIDRSFVQGLPDDQDDLAITQAVIAMAHSLGLQVVAEGVETNEQLQALRRLGCDEIQGYLTGRPMPAAELVERLTLTAGNPTLKHH